MLISSEPSASGGFRYVMRPCQYLRVDRGTLILGYDLTHEQSLEQD